MDDTKLLKQKLMAMIERMKSNRRKRLDKFCNWWTTSNYLFEMVFNLKNWTILQKGERLISFTIVHEEGCKGRYNCSCTETVADPLITVFYFSKLFSEMISVSHFQLWFQGEWNPKTLSDIVDGISITSKLIELFTIGEIESEHIYGPDPEHGVADDEEFEKEESPDFQSMLEEYNSLLCEYLVLAFTDPTSLPTCLLDVDEGPTMRLSELIAWLEESVIFPT